MGQMVERADSQRGQLPPRHIEKLGTSGSTNDIGRRLEEVFTNRKITIPSFRELPDLAPDIKSDESVNCVHRWVVGLPEGGKSSGTCKKCGETRVFITPPESYSPRGPRPELPPIEPHASNS